MRVFRSEYFPYLAALFFNLPFLAFKYYEISYDAFTHIFFANHYARDWFNIWESKWYGGFLVTGYAPLAHQVMAIFSFFAGLEYSYAILALLTILFLIWSLKNFSETIGLKSSMSKWLIAFMPSIYVFIYIFGQLPALLSSAFFISSSNYLDKRGRLEFLIGSLLLSLSFMTHFLMPFLLSPFLIIILKKQNLLRIFSAILLSVIIASPLIIELYNFLISTPSQAPIVHASRGAFLLTIFTMDFFWGIYGPLVFFFPLLFFYLAKRRKWRVLLLSSLFLIFGLGGNTPIPRILLGESIYNWLTFEKFSLLASFLLILALSHYIEIKKSKSMMVSLISAFLISTLMFLLIIPQVIPLQTAKPDIISIASFLNSQKEEGFYITLGLGQWSRELSIITDKPTLDGGYNTARRLEILASSGVESIDAAKVFPGGIDLLRKLLSEDLGIKWVVSADAYYNSLLKEKGYVEIKEIKGESNVIIWYKNSTGFKEIYENKTIISYSWGSLPIATLIIAISLISFQKLKIRRKT